jgi:hypothetical protein
MKDKRELESGQIVLLEVSKRQKKAGPGANCPFWGFKKTKESRTRGKLSFWGLQKDKRELESEQIVHLEVSKRQKKVSKRQKKAGTRANCLFGGLKKTKENARATSWSFPGPGKKNKKQTAPF